MHCRSDSTMSWIGLGVDGVDDDDERWMGTVVATDSSWGSFCGGRRRR